MKTPPPPPENCGKSLGQATRRVKEPLFLRVGFCAAVAAAVSPLGRRRRRRRANDPQLRFVKIPRPVASSFLKLCSLNFGKGQGKICARLNTVDIRLYGNICTVFDFWHFFVVY